MRNILTALLSLLALSGCISFNSIPSVANENNATALQLKATHKMMVGVPLLASLEGSYTDLGNGWAITAAHNAIITTLTLRESYYNSKYDIALFRTDKKDYKVNLGVVHEGEEITTLGYPVFMPLSSNKGYYITEATSNHRHGADISVISNANMSGMSGGGVWNSKGELVGVIVGNVETVTFPDGHKERGLAAFQSVNAVKEWIKSITGMEVNQ